MERFTSKSTGRLALVIGGISVLALVSLIIFFIGYFNDLPALGPFGPANDVLGALEAVLSAVLASMLIPPLRKQPFWFVIFLLLVVAAWIGALIVTIDSLEAGGIISGVTRANLRINYGLGVIARENLHYGFGLISVWLMVLNMVAFVKQFWTPTLAFFGLLAGMAMFIGLAGGRGALGFVVLYPAWCIWLGRWILKNEAAG